MAFSIKEKMYIGIDAADLKCSIITTRLLSELRNDWLTGQRKIANSESLGFWLLLSRLSGPNDIHWTLFCTLQLTSEDAKLSVGALSAAKQPKGEKAKKKFPVLEAQRLVSRNTSEFILICWTPKVKNWQLTSWKNNMLRKVKYAIYHRIVLTQLQLNFFWYQIFLIPFPGLWSGTKCFRYRYRDFFRYQIFPIPVPRLFSGTKFCWYWFRDFFSVPNFSDTGSGTFFRY